MEQEKNLQGQETQPEDNKEEKIEEKEQLFTQSDVNDIISKRLVRDREKWEKEFEEKLAKEKEEAKRLATLSAEEKEKELLKQKESEIAEREQAILRKELELDTINILAEEKLPLTFKDLLIGQDAESTQANIVAFKEEWHKAIQEEMKEKIKSQSLTRNTSQSNTVSLGEQLAKAGTVEKKEHNFF